MARTATAPSEELVPISAAAREIGISHKTLYNQCVEGYVEHYAFGRPGPGHRTRLSIPRREIERLKADAYRPRIPEAVRAKEARQAMKPTASRAKKAGARA